MQSAKCAALCLACLFLARLSWAVLPPEEHEKFQQGFLLSVNVKAELGYLGIAQGEWIQGKGRVCQARYSVIQVSEQPHALGMAAGDEIVLTYACNGAGQWNWMGSTLPWAKENEEGGFNLQISRAYLKADGPGRWLIENDTNVFAPPALRTLPEA